jgi:hypothetical protein
MALRKHAAIFSEGAEAFWTAKRLSECPYVGAKADAWYEGYAAAEKLAHEDWVNSGGSEFN